jgi:O-antigen/teichoic acid export membrane protein
MTPFFPLLFGVQKAAAAPVFVMLSLSAILGIATVGLYALFHYFFKPRLITYAQAFGVMAFVLLSGILATEGATGMAVANLGARIAFMASMVVFIKRELASRGITPVFRTLLR